MIFRSTRAPGPKYSRTFASISGRREESSESVASSAEARAAKVGSSTGGFGLSCRFELGDDLGWQLEVFELLLVGRLGLIQVPEHGIDLSIPQDPSDRPPGELGLRATKDGSDVDIAIDYRAQASDNEVKVVQALRSSSLKASVGTRPRKRLAAQASHLGDLTDGKNLAELGQLLERRLDIKRSHASDGNNVDR
jgi:hypothetical protein